MVCLHRIKESCIAKSIIEFLSAEKTIKGLLKLRFFSSHMNSKIFLTAVRCCAAEEGINCHVLDYFQESNEVALRIFKSKLQ